ncbi:hypothetical protein EN858_34415, partial [Mesorhizobium sp. M4B.F.Ca.ET.215.01.1.1]
FAADPAVAERVKSMLAPQGVDISWTGVSGDDSNVTLQAVSIKPAAEKEALPIGDVKLEGVSEADGGFDIATVSTSAFSRTQDDVTLILSPFIIHDMKVP